MNQVSNPLHARNFFYFKQVTAPFGNEVFLELKVIYILCHFPLTKREQNNNLLISNIAKTVLLTRNQLQMTNILIDARANNN